MKTISYLEKEEDIKIFNRHKIDELIISPQKLSRFGKLSIEEAHHLAKLCQEYNIKAVLEWDILMTQEVFTSLKKDLNEIDWNLFAAVRVQDPGALKYLQENQADKKIQLILETGNNNLSSIETWIKAAGNNLERVVLSLEIPKEKLKDYIKKISPRVEVELLVLGRILLLYTPRHLLAPLVGEKSWQGEARADSEEGKHKKLTVLENSHGTFLFNPRDRCLLEHLPEIQEMGHFVARFDFRFGRDANLLSDIFPRLDLEKVRRAWPVLLNQGFFRANHTDVVFKDLKNHARIRKEANYLGEIVEAQKKQHLALVLRSKLTVNKNDLVKIYTPNGKTKNLRVTTLTNSKLQPVESATEGDVVLIPHLSGVTTRSSVYLDLP